MRGNCYLISIELPQRGILCFKSGSSFSKPHRSAELTRVVFRHVDDHRVARVWVDLSRVRVFLVQNVSGKLDHGTLEAKAYSEEWPVIGSSPVGGSDLSLNSAGTEAAGYKNA